MKLNVQERITTLLEENLQISKSEINETQDLLELGMTSLSFVQIIVAFENEFDIEFDDDDFNAEKFKNVNDFVFYIEKKIAA